MSTQKKIASPCVTCPAHNIGRLIKPGLKLNHWDYVVALAGNPNTGKSTLFNALTGLRQHTGNWPGKTVGRAEGIFTYAGQGYKLVDLPGTYSLLSTSPDEEVARDFILFGQPEVTVVVVDATRLERNLNLVLQVLEITDRVVIALNLMDEARRHGLSVDERRLAQALGVPVAPTSARSGQGIPELLQAIQGVATGQVVCRPRRIKNEPPSLKQALSQLTAQIETVFPSLPNTRWVAMRLLDGDQRIVEAVKEGELGELSSTKLRKSVQTSEVGAEQPRPEALLETAEALRWQVGAEFHEGLVEAIYTEAAHIADRAVRYPDRPPRFNLDRTIDRLVTSRLWGFPLMLLLLTFVFWLTISGANLPSKFLAFILLDTVHPFLKNMAAAAGLPWWLAGLLIDGMYLSTAWVVSVMLPPMAIFFPLFTLLEDFGYLPRVAFNLDNFFKKAGAHGKQALSMSMGFGCNAAGVVAARIIDSPRERLIAILTNNFSLCNGRWPTQILLATVFMGGLVSAQWAGLISALAVVSVALLGVFLSLAVSWSLSSTLLKGEVSTFSLELPPYRPPRLWQTIYTSIIDRTMIVLWRAVVFALPAGAVIWLVSNVTLGGAPLAQHFINWLNPLGYLLGLNGIILLAYVVAIPANEIVIPTVLMLTSLVLGAGGAGVGVMFELDSLAATETLLRAGGWTLLTAVNVMLFSLLHNPCSTTLYGIYKETGSRKWTLMAALLPLGLGFAVTFVVAQAWRWAG